MPRLKKYPLFISHAWDHSSDYDSLERHLKDAKRFDCRNCSIPKARGLDTKTDRQLEGKLRNQIRPAHSVLIIAGMYVKHRKWIKKEIEIALSMGKNIIIVKPHGAQKMPRELRGFPQQVGWDTKNIIRAIKAKGHTKFVLSTLILLDFSITKSISPSILSFSNFCDCGSRTPR